MKHHYMKTLLLVASLNILGGSYVSAQTAKTQLANHDLSPEVTVNKGDTLVVQKLDNAIIMYTNLNNAPYRNTCVDLITMVINNKVSILNRVNETDATSVALFINSDLYYRQAISEYLGLKKTNNYSGDNSRHGGQVIMTPEAMKGLEQTIRKKVDEKVEEREKIQK